MTGERRETVLCVQSNLSGELQRSFAEVLDPRLVTLLQEQLQPLSLSLQESERASMRQHEIIVSKLESNSADLKLLQDTQAALITSSQASQQNDAFLARLREQGQLQEDAIQTITQHITSAIRDLKVEPARHLEVVPASRGQLLRRRRTNRLDQPLRTLQEASDEKALTMDL